MIKRESGSKFIFIQFVSGMNFNLSIPYKKHHDALHVLQMLTNIQHPQDNISLFQSLHRQIS
jgi:hypothetical protein